MANNPQRPSTSSAGISGDFVILLVFLGIGTLLFISFALKFITPSHTTATPTFSLAASATGLESDGIVTPTLTEQATGTGMPTLPFITGTATDPLSTGKPSLTSNAQTGKTNTPVIYKSSTPVKTKTPIRTKTNTPVRTATRTPTPTVTVTSTVTTTMTPVTNCVAEEPGSGLPVLGDTWIDANEPAINHGIYTSLLLRADNNSDKRILLKFDLSSLSASSIANAKLYLYINSTSGATISLYGLSKPWNGTEATWKLAEAGTAWTNEGGDYNVVPLISVVKMADANCRVQLDITKLFQSWPTTTNAEFGVILIASGASGEINISSSRVTPVANRPVLLVVTITPTATVTSTSTLTLTLTRTPTSTVTPTRTSTQPSTVTSTVTETVTLTLTPTPTPTSTPTLTETSTP